MDIKLRLIQIQASKISRFIIKKTMTDTIFNKLVTKIIKAGKLFLDKEYYSNYTVGGIGIDCQSFL